MTPAAGCREAGREEGAAAIIQGQRDNGLAPGWHAAVTSDQVLDRFEFATT